MSSKHAIFTSHICIVILSGILVLSNAIDRMGADTFYTMTVPPAVIHTAFGFWFIIGARKYYLQGSRLAAVAVNVVYGLIAAIGVLVAVGYYIKSYGEGASSDVSIAKWVALSAHVFQSLLCIFNLAVFASEKNMKGVA